MRLVCGKCDCEMRVMHWQKLSEILRRDEYSGCFIPSFVLKVLYYNSGYER